MKVNKEKEENLKLDWLKELLEYNPYTGQLIWVKLRHGVKVGSVAGSIDKYGYSRVKIDGVLFLAHRLVWFYCKGTWPNNYIDHLNRDKSDNRIENLRDVSQQTNMENTSKYKRDDVSLPTGISATRYKGAITAYVAYWQDINGKTCYSPSFNIKSYRRKCVALLAAKLYREAKVNERNAEGANYTSQHGN